MLFFKKKSSKHTEKYNKEQIKKTLRLRKSPVDNRDYPISQLMLKARLKVPVSIDLSPFCTSIKNQGQLGSCSAFAGGAHYETMMNIKGTKSKLDCSELFIYYCERAQENMVNQDSGSTMRDCAKALTNTGASEEKLWPYVISNFTKKPSLLAYASGRKTKGISYYFCQTLDEIKFALSNNKTVIFGMTVYPAYFDYKKGIYSNIDGRAQGGHAQLIVGYDDKKKALRIRNSWGEQWGEKGYVWIDYDTFIKIMFEAVVVIY